MLEIDNMAIEKPLGFILKIYVLWMTVQYYVVSGGKCRLANEAECLWVMCSPIPEILDNPYNKDASGKGLKIIRTFAESFGDTNC